MIDLAISFTAGVLTILAPCTLPVVPMVLGSSVGGGHRRLVGIFAGFACSFVTVTILLASALAASGLTTDRLRLVSAALLGIVGLSLVVGPIGRWSERALQPIATIAAQGLRRVGLGDGLAGGLAIGAGIGLIWAPCVGPLMAAAIALATVRGPSLHALAVATAYVAGAALPLFAVARWGRRVTTVIGQGRAALWRRGFGGAMAVTALIVLTGVDVPLQARLTSLLPAGAEQALTAYKTDPLTEQDATTPGAGDPAPAGNVPLEDLGPAPELAGITSWINSEPTTVAAQRGKVVLVHFWTFGCINCIHVQPYVKTWYDRYADAGLVVLAVHTPELSFEREIDNVRDAVAEAGVRYPVAFDPSYATWNAYGNRYWPAFYFIDKAGTIRHVHFGEGDYEGSEAVIRELLSEAAPS